MANEHVTMQVDRDSVTATQREKDVEISISAEGRRTNEVWMLTSNVKTGAVLSEVAASEDGHVLVKHYGAHGKIDYNQFEGQVGRDIVAAYNEAMRSGTIDPKAFDKIQRFGEQASKQHKGTQVPYPGFGDTSSFSR